MSKKKSLIDNLFFEIYGCFPNKSGEAYERIANTALKIISGWNYKFNQHLKGKYSETDYQIDSYNEIEKKVLEAKDYTIGKKKVGRPDLQKLQGALTDLEVESGLFVSATDYTKPAKDYANSTNKNPFQKQIELFEIRSSSKEDEKNRINCFSVDLTMIIPDYDNGKFDLAWSKKSLEKFEGTKYIRKIYNLKIDRFYKKNGKIDCFISDFSYKNQPIPTNENDISNGCWIIVEKYIKLDDILYEIKGISYSIPFKRNKRNFEVKIEGKSKILIKSEDGNINKLLTDEQFKKFEK